MGIWDPWNTSAIPLDDPNEFGDFDTDPTDIASLISGYKQELPHSIKVEALPMTRRGRLPEENWIRGNQEPVLVKLEPKEEIGFGDIGDDAFSLPPELPMSVGRDRDRENHTDVVAVAQPLFPQPMAQPSTPHTAVIPAPAPPPNPRGFVTQYCTLGTVKVALKMARDESEKFSVVVPDILYSSPYQTDFRLEVHPAAPPGMGGDTTATPLQYLQALLPGFNKAQQLRFEWALALETSPHQALEASVVGSRTGSFATDGALLVVAQGRVLAKRKEAVHPYQVQARKRPKLEDNRQAHIDRLLSEILQLPEEEQKYLEKQLKEKRVGIKKSGAVP